MLFICIIFFFIEVIDFDVDDVKDSVLFFLSFLVVDFLVEIEIINFIFKKKVTVKKIVVKSKFKFLRWVNIGIN